MATYNIITLGCSKNTVDSEVVAAQLKKEGHTVFFDSTVKTDFVIVNTCSFIRDSKEQSIDEILLHVERKKQGDVKKVFVMGCLSERYHDELQEIIPEADGIYAFNELNTLVNTPQFELLNNSNRILSTPKHYAYMKISEGCDHECSFCAIPLIRGKQISKPVELLVEEAEKLADQGVKELMLIAQDLTYYGMDLYQKRDLERLMRKIGQVKGLEWIRLHYAYPLGFPYEILDVMNEYSTFCKYLDIPFQHISDPILKSMRRGGNSMQNYKLIETIRNKVPGIALRTTLISGYPGETKADHQQLVDFVREMRFERLGVFAYSPEENTPAFPLGDPIKEREKNKRIEEIMLLQEQISLEHNQSKVGSVMKVIIDTKEDGKYFGRTEFDSPDVDNAVIISAKKKVEIGTFQSVYIDKADNYDLFGTIV
ncbi:MAG TPA: 30S ribosomal protein S12 methylthiotransferase RimO [Bacteroidales bacterium]|nr:30S ribosomal protein S12 methylthiotransferase RimO [Bacteroidales bacterium]HPS71696.1 30S ribosomal protein S12 methylthiotransferase RimO [Bacteroidales bacterium]